MNAKPKPSEEELRELYVVQGLSTKAIGLLYGFSDTTINNWLVKYSIPVHPQHKFYGCLNPEGVNTGNALENTICPVSISRLHELYWIKAQSTAQIADYFSTNFGRVYSDVLVLAWLHKASIPVRTRGHGYSVRAKQTPEIYKSSLLAANRASRLSPNRKPLPPAIWKKIQKKGNESEKARHLNLRIQLCCDYCGKQFTRPPHKTKGKMHQFDSNECCIAFYTRKRKLEKLLTRPKPALTPQDALQQLGINPADVPTLLPS